MADKNKAMEEKKDSPVIHVTIGKSFDIQLQAMTGSTGYDWFLTGLPEGIILIEIQKIPVLTTMIAPMRVIFTFTSSKVGTYQVDFKKLRIWEPQVAAEHVEYTVIVEKAGLDKHLGSDKFVDMATHMEHIAGPIPPYGFTDPGEPALRGTVNLLYGYPPPHLLYGFPPYVKYGFPPHIKYGFPPLVKYGFPPHMKYGFPCELANIVEDKDRCVVMYGTPWGVAQDSANCTVKYGFPIGLDDMENCFDKTRFPKGVIEDKKNCMLMYGVQFGISKENCTLKYGFPPTEK